MKLAIFNISQVIVSVGIVNFDFASNSVQIKIILLDSLSLESMGFRILILKFRSASTSFDNLAFSNFIFLSMLLLLILFTLLLQFMLILLLKDFVIFLLILIQSLGVASSLMNAQEKLSSQYFVGTTKMLNLPQCTCFEMDQCVKLLCIGCTYEVPLEHQYILLLKDSPIKRVFQEQPQLLERLKIYKPILRTPYPDFPPILLFKAAIFVLNNGQKCFILAITLQLNIVPLRQNHEIYLLLISQQQLCLDKIKDKDSEFQKYVQFASAYITYSLVQSIRTCWVSQNCLYCWPFEFSEKYLKTLGMIILFVMVFLLNIFRNKVERYQRGKYKVTSSKIYSFPQPFELSSQTLSFSQSGQNHGQSILRKCI